MPGRGSRSGPRPSTSICRELLQPSWASSPAATRQLHRDILQGTLAPPRPIPFLAPVPPPHYVPREATLAALLAQLQPGAGLALVGMGGVGKSTLAAALARAARHRFPDGVLWASAELSPPEEILLTWAKFLRLRPERPHQSGRDAHRVARHCRRPAHPRRARRRVSMPTRCARSCRTAPAAPCC
jgi:hypothetical protein